MTQTTTSNVAVMQETYEAFARGDVPAVLERMDPQIEWYEAEGNPWDPGRAFRGPQEVVDGVFTRIATEYDDFRVDITRLLDAGDTVIAEARYRSSRAKATGKPLDAQVCHIWDLRNGRITRFQQYVDTRQLAEVLGD